MSVSTEVRGHDTSGAVPTRESVTAPVAALRDAELRYGPRVLWRGLNLDVAPGEFLVVLGPNGSGKTSLLRVLLGLAPLTSGTATIAGRTVGRGNRGVGYVPQHKPVEPWAVMRGRDLVALGVAGHRWGLGLTGRRALARRVDDALEAVAATAYADRPVGMLSGGEQQRLRVAQALAGDPAVLLCDEPLLSLDLAHQRAVAELIDTRRRAEGIAVVFVTHEINPVLPMADRVLYLVDGRFRVGPVTEVMTSRVLTDLYGTEVDVLRVRDQLLVVGATGDHAHHPGEGE